MMSLQGTIARGLIVIASIWTSALQLFAPTSLAYQAAGSGVIIDFVNVIVLALAGLAALDLLWHDILRRGLVWPSFPHRQRHQICVWVYSLLAAAFGIRAFIAAGEPSTVIRVGMYYVLLSAFIAAEAYALADEQREEHPCPTPSASD